MKYILVTLNRNSIYILRQVRSCSAPFIFYNNFRSALSYNLPASLSCTRPNVNYPVTGGDYFHVVLHQDDRISSVNQAV